MYEDITKHNITARDNDKIREASYVNDSCKPIKAINEPYLPAIINSTPIET